MPSARAEYRIEIGDVVDFDVASLPNLKQRAAVDVNGQINLPLLQDITAAGLPLTELRTKVRELISAKPFRQRNGEGRETLLTIDPDEITISMVEYRPIYVAGDVGRPGEQVFRPGMTVRQAMATSAGAGPVQSQAQGRSVQAADLKSEYTSLWANLLANRSTISRLQAQLEGRSDMPELAVIAGPIAPPVQEAIIRRETDELKSQTANFSKEQQSIQEAVGQTERFLEVLGEQQKNEKEGADLDAQDFNRVSDLFSRGAVPVTRVTDARRSMLLSSTRQLQTSVQLAENQIRKNELIRSIDRLADTRRVELLSSLQEASVKSLDLQARLRAVAAKMALTGTSREQGGNDEPPRLEIFRKGEPPMTAEDDTELQPGDVLQVTRKDDLLVSSTVP